jgi:uncharacterized protein with HEPN domain
MVTLCERVLAYTQGVEREAFTADEMRYDATLRNLELLGEAATHVPDELRERAPGIPWRQVIAARNRLIHADLGSDLDSVWRIVRDAVPALHRVLSAVRHAVARRPQATVASVRHRHRECRARSGMRCRSGRIRPQLRPSEFGRALAG